MRRNVLFACIALAIVSCALAGTTPEVITLTDTTFFQSLAAAPNAIWLVEFYAPWCGHCKRLAPIWDDLAIALHARDDVEFRVAKVDCTANRDIQSAFGIKGFPTLKLIKGDKMYEIDTERTVEAFSAFAADESAWKDESVFPPKIEAAKPNRPVRAAEPEPEHAEPTLDFNPEKILADLQTVVFKHPYAAGTIGLIGFLVGLLMALLLCFPSPRVINMQLDEDVKAAAPATGPKIKEE